MLREENNQASSSPKLLYNTVIDEHEERHDTGHDHGRVVKRKLEDYELHDIGDSWMSEDLHPCIEKMATARAQAAAAAAMAAYPYYHAAATSPHSHHPSAFNSTPLESMYFMEQIHESLMMKQRGFYDFLNCYDYEMPMNEHFHPFQISSPDRLSHPPASASTSVSTSATSSASSSSFYLPLEATPPAKTKSSKKLKKSHNASTTSLNSANSCGSMTTMDPSSMASTGTTPTRRHCSKACQHCRASHLSCDNQRPCQRCRNAGRTDCRDYVHRKRGRPRTRNIQPPAHATVPSVLQHPSLDVYPHMTNDATVFPPPPLPSMPQLE